jgi:LemA protein
MLAFVVILVLLLALGIWLAQIYNQLVMLKAQFENAFAQIEVQLRRRYDLIPNLVETVKGYLRHEQTSLTAVIEARNAASALLKTVSQHPANGSLITQLGQAEGRLTQALGGLNVQLEAYPELKANENIQQLFEELTATENRVAFARQAFNDGVTSYNIFRKQFPNILIAARVGHNEDATLLEIEDPEQYHQAPRVNF